MKRDIISVCLTAGETPKQLQLFAATFLFGTGIVVSYCLMDLFRRRKRTRKLSELCGELVYWTGCAILAYWIQYRLNNGILRFYSVLGAAAGLVLCRMLTRRLFDKLAASVDCARRKRIIHRRKARISHQNRLKKIWNRVTMIVRVKKSGEDKSS